VRIEDGSNITDVTVTLDGTRLATRLDGKAVSVDPGEHVLTFVADGYPTFETPTSRSMETRPARFPCCSSSRPS